MSTVKDYLESLDEDKRKVVSKVRTLIRKHLPKGYKESYNWGMIAYEVPLKTLPDTYNKKPLLYCAIAANKNNYSLHLMCVYSDEKLNRRLQEGYKKAGKKLDMGKGCVRFKHLEDLEQDVIGNIIAATSMDNYIANYRQARKKAP